MNVQVSFEVQVELKILNIFENLTSLKETEMRRLVRDVRSRSALNDAELMSFMNCILN